MKLLIAVSILVLSTSTFGQSQAKLKEQITALKAEQRADYKAVLKDLAESRNTATGLHDNLVTAQTQINKVGTERDGWRDWGNAQHELWLNAEVRVAKESKAKQKWMGLFFGLFTLILGWFAFKLFVPMAKLLPI